MFTLSKRKKKCYVYNFEDSSEPFFFNKLND